MNTVRVIDKDFKVYIDQDDIAYQVHDTAEELSEEFADCEGGPLFVCVLNGAFMFAADLFRSYEGEADIDFIKVSSYEGTETTGKVKSVMGLKNPVKGRDVILVEDIVDSGLTIYNIKQSLMEQGANSVTIVALLVKPDAIKYPVEVDYPLFKIPNKFVVGYGLDYNEQGRNLPEIYIACDEK